MELACLVTKKEQTSYRPTSRVKASTNMHTSIYGVCLNVCARNYHIFTSLQNTHQAQQTLSVERSRLSV